MDTVWRNMLLIFILGICINQIQSRSTDVVQTAKGPVQGEILTTVINKKEYSSFKGIPYGEPPLGKLRFRPPVEKKPWTEVRQTTIEGANCVQKDFVYHKNYTGSEDCLYLNVHTPETELSKAKNNLRPVMVWIYGGTFKSGYGNSSLYGPDFIIEEDVVLVTFNYRLGPLGFLSANHELATGNAALKDQNLVLRWVKENIHNFGGDPNSVTLFGQSAGGVAVDLHGLSDMSKGLFHRSISMSASPLCPWAFHTPSHAEKQAFKLGYELGLTPGSDNKDDLLKLLYEAPALKLMQITEKLGSSSPPFAPTLERSDLAPNEEKFLTECAYIKYKSGDFTKVPHLTGFTKDEALLFTGSIESFREMMNSTSDYLRSLPSKSPVKIPYWNEIFGSLSTGIDSFSDSLIMSAVTQSSDILFVQGIDSKQRYLQRKSGHPVYYYRLSYETDRSLHKLFYNIPFKGVAHGDDLAYLFHMTVTNLSLEANDPTFIVRKRVVRLWTNFAKHSNPTPDGEKDQLLQGVTWPDSGKDGTHLEINENLSVGKRPISLTVQTYELMNDISLPRLTGCPAANPFTRYTNGMATVASNLFSSLF